MNFAHLYILLLNLLYFFRFASFFKSIQGVSKKSLDRGQRKSISEILKYILKESFSIIYSRSIFSIIYSRSIYSIIYSRYLKLTASKIKEIFL